ncbi:hypothetical protein MHI27_14110 [Paenibacillus sp. FSL H8-0261]|uniref:hypothetical protein n=1 Tax=Paenibacillus sp. FSL H8-0261 TaxID=2921381 RepID=UPI003249BCF5
MNTQLVNLQFSDTYLMVNFEITFQEIQSWLSMTGHNMDDASLFRALLFPESLDSDQQTELCWTILHRYEDVFFLITTGRIRNIQKQRTLCINY